ncbi:NrdH-redoxin, partial [Enterococcus faecium]|nr:NrdH-redoxin [Enterococcus faecium]
MNVKIFSKNYCMHCKMVKRILTENQISFKEVNINEQPEAVD